MDSLGLPRTTLHSKLFSRESSIAPDSSARYGVGVTTPLEMARLFALLYQGSVVSAQVSGRLIELLQKQSYRTMIPRHLTGVTVANKTGSVDAARADCGIIDTDVRDFVLCVFTKDNQDRSWRLDNEAEVLIGDVARLVHAALTSRATK
jgi:hypothetical protein